MIGIAADAGLALERIAAVDGEDSAVAARAARVRPGFLGFRLSAGAYACYQSHRGAWSRLVASGESHALVMEDDLIFSPDIGRYLDPDWVPADADLVKLESFRGRSHLDRGPGLAAGPRRLCRLRSRNVGAGCYVVARRTAEFLLAETAESGTAVDEDLFNDRSPLFPRLVTYQMLPAPARQGKVSDQKGSDWTKGSITARFDAADRSAVEMLRRDNPRGKLDVLRQRLRESWRGLKMNTRYCKVPFG